MSFSLNPLKDMNQKGSLKIVVSVVILIVLTIVYFVITRKTSVLQNKLQTSTTTQTVSVPVYVNTEFGFEVTVPPSWAGYKVERHVTHGTNLAIVKAPDVVWFSFSLKDGDRDYQVYSVALYPKTFWDQIYDSDSVMGGGYLGEQNGFVFQSGGHEQDGPQYLDVAKIFDRKNHPVFKFTHPPENKITRNDWGVSFLRGNDWDVTTNSEKDGVVLTKMSGEDRGDRITISHFSTSTITDTDSKFGSVTYFYDKSAEVWMKAGHLSEMTGQNIPSAPAVSEDGPEAGGLYSLDGFPIFLGTSRWRTYIIPLSNSLIVKLSDDKTAVNSILKLNITGSGSAAALDDLVRTVKKV
jgi:hypothetical protein